MHANPRGFFGRFARLTSLLLTLSLFITCIVDGTPAEGPSGREADPSTITLLLPTWYDHRVLLPPTNWPRMHLLFEPLFARDSVGEIEGRLVRSWEHSEDGRTWTYHFRTDAFWHDGVPVTAHDLKFTYDRAGALGTFGSLDAVQTTVLDDSTAMVHYARRGHDPLDDYSVLLPAHLLQGMPPDSVWEWEFWEAPVGNGPYRWVRRDPGIMVELVANQGYYRTTPSIERVIVKLANNPVAELMAGNVDVTGWVVASPEAVAALRNEETLNLYWMPQPDQSFIFLNHRHPAFADVRVRKALNLAIDHRLEQQLQEVPGEVPYFDVPLTPAQLARNEYPAPRPHDPDEARRLLDTAGWTDTDGDGIREKNGQDLAFTLLTVSRSVEGGGAIFVFLQAEFRRVGVRLEIQPMQVSATRERFRAGEFDAHGPGTGQVGSVRFWRDLLGEKGEGDGATGYQNDRLFHLAQALDTTLVPARRDSIVQAMWPIFREEVPVISLGPRVYFTLAHERVKGLRSPDRVWAESHMADLWIEKEGG